VSDGPGPDDDVGDATRPIDVGEATAPIDVGDETRPVDVSDETRPTDVSDATAPFAPAAAPDEPLALVSPTAANLLLADTMPPTAAPDGGGLDALFADSHFHDYDAAAAPPPPAPVGTAYERAAPPRPPAPPVRHLTTLQRTLLGVTGGIVALGVLAALFFVGTRLPASDADPAPSPTPTRSTPTPVPTVLPPGPVAVGEHRWDQLLGGECLADFTGPWAQRYTVVDCATPHPAQLVFRGRFADPATPGYPGEAALQAQMSVLCSAPGVIDLGAASQYTDAQIESSFPASAAQWDAGDHWYYCFVTRSSKQPLTGSVAVAHPAS
jgi:hypothetical protein